MSQSMTHVPHCNPACTPESHFLGDYPREHLHTGNLSGYCEACRATDPPSWHEVSRMLLVSTPSGFAAGLEGQDATQEPHDATEAAQGRVERYAEAIYGDGIFDAAQDDDWPDIASAVIAVADQEQAELRQRVKSLTAALDMLACDCDDHEDWHLAHAVSHWKVRAETAEAEVQRLMLAKGPALFEEMLTAVLSRAEAAEARVAELEATVARVRALTSHLHTDTIYAGDLRAILDPTIDEGSGQ